MENKINIAELLKDCPKGMELYSPIFGIVYFQEVRNTGRAELIIVTTSCNSTYEFYNDGKFNTYYSDSEMLLFPSKDQRDWSKFQRPFKVGDRIKHKESGIYCHIGEYVESLKGYKTNIGYVIRYDDIDNWELVIDKFHIDTLVPFESRVLVRDVDGDLWKPAIFGFSYSGCCYGVGGFYWKQCIPYESNENLLGTTHNCDEYYKTWE